MFESTQTPNGLHIPGHDRVRLPLGLVDDCLQSCLAVKGVNLTRLTGRGVVEVVHALSDLGHLEPALLDGEARVDK
eukprot:7578994-Prorocentrum_lima.AAC.1